MTGDYWYRLSYFVFLIQNLNQHYLEEHKNGEPMTNKKVTGPENTIKIEKGVPLKNSINRESIRHDALIIQSVYPVFPVDEFVDATVDDSWDDLELMARGRKLTESLVKYLPADYKEALEIIDKIVDNHAMDITVMGMSFPDYVEINGLGEENFDFSMDALEKYTTYWSSEFAVRPFIINHEERMMKKMYLWSKHENEHVRRLSSEGCRPQLPWAQSLPAFKKDPAPIFPILEQLKTDPSQYVRKSVANNMNDISKTHPELVAKLAKDWYGQNEYTDWIIKHGCRTLLKKGNRHVLDIFGYHDAAIQVEGLSADAKSISIGEDMIFSFTINAKEDTKIRIEYGIDYVKASGKRSRKIFQISESSLKENVKKEYNKKHSFADVSTRKHYPGKHSFTLIVNGVEKGTLDFDLNK